tara:strand:+ start:167 stop:520 length:354 start_codon:yes stop_codon:yes gene_type:complete
VKKKANPKTIFGIKKKIREVTHIYNNQPLIGKIMTEEERKRLALKRKNKKFFDDYKKSITGVAAGEKEMEILTKSIPNLTQKKDTSEKGTMADFVSKMGGSVSEEELKRIKALISKR